MSSTFGNYLSFFTCGRELWFSNTRITTLDAAGPRFALAGRELVAGGDRSDAAIVRAWQPVEDVDALVARFTRMAEKPPQQIADLYNFEICVLPT